MNLKSLKRDSSGEALRTASQTHPLLLLPLPASPPSVLNLGVCVCGGLYVHLDATSVLLPNDTREGTRPDTLQGEPGPDAR